MLALDFSTGTVPPANNRRLTRTWFDDAGRSCGRTYVDGPDHWIDWDGLGLFRFRRDVEIVWVWPAPDVAHETVVETFSRMLQPVVLQAMGRQALHASGAAGPSGVLAFCGRAGSGKSTIARAVDRGGLFQIADDALVLQVTAANIAVEPLPFCSRLREASREHFGDQAPPVRRPLRSADQVLRAVFVLRQQDDLAESARAEPLLGAAAFEALLTHAHTFDETDPQEMRRLVEDYLAIADRVPVFALAYRPRFDELSKLVDLVLCVARRLALGASKTTPVSVP